MQCWIKLVRFSFTSLNVHCVEHMLQIRKKAKNVITKKPNPNVLSLTPYVGSQGVGCCQVLNQTLSSHYNCCSLLEHLLFQKYNFDIDYAGNMIKCGT
jgi:hypothetical protein